MDKTFQQIIDKIRLNNPNMTEKEILIRAREKYMFENDRKKTIKRIS